MTEEKKPAPKRRGRPPKPATATCRVLVPNLWTSKGKFFAKDDVELPADEAKALEDADKVVIK